MLGTLVLASFWRPVEVSATRSVNEIKREQESLKEEIGALDSELVAIVSSIAELQSAIDAKEAEIAETKAMIREAKAAVDQQYESMKIRIQYMYENGQDSAMTILLESGSLSDFLNRLEYVNAVHEYDRELLERFQAAQKELEALEMGLEEEKADLDVAQAELSAQKTELNQMITAKKGELSDVNAELKKAEELAARQAELRRQQQLAAQNAAQNTPAGTTGGAGNSSGSNSSGSAGPNVGASSSQNVTGDLNPGQVTGVSGSSVVAYANQFVGNPYVFGGSSLTNGIDCSGFVWKVYEHFGIGLGSSRPTSYSLRSVGQEVSYNNLQLGDIVCYPGHVAIYAGGGRIVEARNPSAGITNTRSVNCATIVTIRRVI